MSPLRIRRRIFVASLLSVFLSGCAAAAWIRSSYGIDDVWSLSGLRVVSSDKELLIGDAGTQSPLQFHQRFGLNQAHAGLGGWVYMLFVGDTEPERFFYFHDFILCWGESEGNYSYLAVPAWAAALAFGVTPFFFFASYQLRRRAIIARNILWIGLLVSLLPTALAAYGLIRHGSAAAQACGGDFGPYSATLDGRIVGIGAPCLIGIFFWSLWQVIWKSSAVAYSGPRGFEMAPTVPDRAGTARDHS